MGVLQCPAVWSQAVWQGLRQFGPCPSISERCWPTLSFSTQDTRCEGWAWVRYTHTCTHAETLSALTHVHIDVTRHTVKGLKLWWRLGPFNQGHAADLCNDPHVSSPSCTTEHGDEGAGKAALSPQHCRSPLPTPTHWVSGLRKSLHCSPPIRK